MSDPLLELRAEDFARLTGQQIPIDFGHGPCAATILSAVAYTGPTNREGGGFSVWLKAPVQAPQQGTFAVSLPERPAIGIFLSPRRQDGSDVVYEAVFN